jgi:hypothetical protein
MAGQDDEFIQILKSSASYLAESSRQALQWFKDKVMDIIKGAKKRIADKIFTPTTRPQIGKMYLYFYDAKYKDILPYFDMYPLVFPIEFYNDGFLGINLHYLPPLSRASLLSNLKKLLNNDKYDDTSRLNISYRILKTHAAQFAGFENCVKRYLFSHMRSSFNEINIADWDKTVLLPLQRWSINPNKAYAGRPPY